MQTDRRTILSLVASGRITSTEAERLLVLSNERTETIWTLAACLVAALLLTSPSDHLLAGIFQVIKELPTALPAAIHQVQVVLTEVVGGIL
jgi:hypothetical protein